MRRLLPGCITVIFPEAIALEALNRQFREGAGGWEFAAKPVDLSTAGKPPIDSTCVDITNKAAQDTPRLEGPK